MRDEKGGNLLITGQWKAEGSTSKVDERDGREERGGMEREGKGILPLKFKVSRVNTAHRIFHPHRSP